MNVIPVELGARRYLVHVGAPTVDEVASLVLGALPEATRIAVLVDEGLWRASPRAEALVSALRARQPALSLRHLPEGERAKTLTEIERTTEWLAGERLDRSAAVVGVGGGAAGDHAGFAAAIFQRGVRFALVPTTLLAMVDASVGGKTAVDLAAGKNLVGAFHQPSVVVADLGFLDTLPDRPGRAGLAEVVKCALVLDEGLLTALEDAAARPWPWPRDLLESVVASAVRVKAAVVAEDERESGRRAILNFGHTLGHALEAASGYSLLHGEAVALGMVGALLLGVQRGTTPAGLRDRAVGLLARLGLPVDAAPRIGPSLVAHLWRDKKRHGDVVRFVLCPGPGRAVLAELAPAEILAVFCGKSPFPVRSSP